MKAIKLMKKAEHYIDNDARKRKEKRKCIKEVMAKLRKYEKKLEKKIEKEESPEKIKQLKKKKKIAHAQRNKALKLMDSLMDKSSSSED